MTGSACKCTYNGGSTWEDNCKCGVAPAPTIAPEPCVQDPHCQMIGSACKCTYNGGSTWEDNCKCGVAPAPTPAPEPSVQEHLQRRLDVGGQLQVRRRAGADARAGALCA